MYIFVIVFLMFLGFVTITSFARRLLDFETELRYLKREIERAIGREKKYWIRRRRKLWLSLLPFVKY